MNRYYLYRHIRTDTNQVFYIGLGTKTEEDLRYFCYSRAISKGGRSFHWHNIVKNCDIIIEIFFECNDYDLLLGKEVEFIALYKRQESGGTLINLTDGGEGKLGWKMSNMTKDKIALANSGLKRSPMVVENLRKKMKKIGMKRSTSLAGAKTVSRPVIQYTLEGKFIKEHTSCLSAVRDIQRDTVHGGRISLAAKRPDVRQAYGFKWKFKDESWMEISKTSQPITSSESQYSGFDI